MLGDRRVVYAFRLTSLFNIEGAFIAFSRRAEELCRHFFTFWRGVQARVRGSQTREDERHFSLAHRQQQHSTSTATPFFPFESQTSASLVSHWFWPAANLLAIGMHMGLNVLKHAADGG